MAKKEKVDGNPQELPNFINVALTAQEISQLLALLSFSSTAAAAFSMQEVIKSNPVAMEQMKDYVKLANLFSQIISDSYYIGEPTDGNVH